MRDNLPAGAVRVEDAPCGCERYACDGHDAEGKVLPGASVLTLHLKTCEWGIKNPSPSGDNVASGKRVLQRAARRK